MGCIVRARTVHPVLYTGMENTLKMFEKLLDAGLPNVALVILFVYFVAVKPLKVKLDTLSAFLREYLDIQKQTVDNLGCLEGTIERLIACIERRSGNDRRSCGRGWVTRLFLGADS